MELHEKVGAVTTKEDLATFVAALKNDLIANKDDWENPDLERFLDAMSAWIFSMDTAHKNLGKETPVQPTWRVFADILLAGKIYE